MKYIIAATTIVNDLKFADGSEKKNIIGGGVFCVGGIKPFEDSIGYVTAAGDDFEDFYGDYFTANNLVTDGVRRSLTKTQYNIVEYAPDGQWREYSIYGDSYRRDNVGKAELVAADLAVFSDEQTKGIYTESGVEEPFWSSEEVAKIRKAAPNAKLLWEVPTYNITDPEQRKHIVDTAKKSDIYSVNLPEGKTLFDVKTEEEVIEQIIKLGIPCFFRVGTKGAYMIMDGKATFAPSVGVEESVDPTGCGNCSTTTSLYGFAEGWEPLHIVAAANITAYYTAKQYGPYPAFPPEMQKKVQSEVTDFLRKLEG